MFDQKLYIVGGSRNGRFLSDVQVFSMPIYIFMLKFFVLSHVQFAIVAGF